MAETDSQQAATPTQPAAAAESKSDASTADASAAVQKTTQQGESSTLMDQPNLNLLMQRWLGDLFLKPQELFSVPVLDYPEGAQSFDMILDRLKNHLKLTTSAKPSLCAGGTHLTVLARGLAAYLSIGLFPRDLDRLSGQIGDEVTKWLLSVFKLQVNSFSGIYHNDPLESLIKVIRVALHLRYGKQLEEGMPSVLHSRPPSIYVSTAGNQTICLKACAKLGLPPGTITTVSCNTMFGATHAMDITALEECINNDTANGKTPLLVLASVGTPVAGHIDNLTRLREIATEYNMWLHAEGNLIATLCLKNEPPEVKPLQDVDSLLLQPSYWFGLLASPCVTLIKTTHTYKSQAKQVEKPPEGETADASDKPPEGGDGEEATPASASTGSAASSTSQHSVTKQVSAAVWASLQPSGGGQLLPLPLWISMQYLGIQSLIDTVIYSNNLAKIMVSRVEKMSGVKRVETPNHWSNIVLLKYVGGGELQASTLPTTSGDTQPRPLSADQQHQESQSGEQNDPSTASADDARPSDDTDAAHPAQASSTTTVVPELPESTSNAFTQMLASELSKVYTKLGLTTVNIPHCGNCIRFDPSLSFPERGASRKDTDKFCDSLEKRASELHPTALARHVFQKAILECSNLRYLDFPAAVAVGFIQYVPEEWAGKKELTVEEVKKLNKRNYELTLALSQHTNLFTGYQHGNFTCIALKMITQKDNIFHLLDLLKSEVAKYEDSIKYIEGMSDMIVKGIETAQQDLAQEKEKLQQEESMLKSLPLVGSLYGWLVASPTGSAKGRTFNLQSGKMESTEKIYEYRMQVKDGDKETSASEETSKPSQDQAEDGQGSGSSQKEDTESSTDDDAD